MHQLFIKRIFRFIQEDIAYLFFVFVSHMSQSFAIEIRDLCKKLDKKEILKQVNLQVREGEIFGFL